MAVPGEMSTLNCCRPILKILHTFHIRAHENLYKMKQSTCYKCSYSAVYTITILPTHILFHQTIFAWKESCVSVVYPTDCASPFQLPARKLHFHGSVGTCVCVCESASEWEIAYLSHCLMDWLTDWLNRLSSGPFGNPSRHARINQKPSPYLETQFFHPLDFSFFFLFFIGILAPSWCVRVCMECGMCVNVGYRDKKVPILSGPTFIFSVLTYAHIYFIDICRELNDVHAHGAGRRNFFGVPNTFITSSNGRLAAGLSKTKVKLKSVSVIGLAILNQGNIQQFCSIIRSPSSEVDSSFGKNRLTFVPCLYAGFICFGIICYVPFRDTCKTAPYSSNLQYIFLKLIL